jgi:hypothetical protein
LRLHGTRKDYKTRGINRKCKSNNLDKIQINNKNNETNKGLKQIWVARPQQKTMYIQAIAHFSNQKYFKNKKTNKQKKPTK